ncbi:hypothetical protein BAE44_0015215, partial [Dichanthelium oligosanthes]
LPPGAARLHQVKKAARDPQPPLHQRRQQGKKSLDRGPGQLRPPRTRWLPRSRRPPNA